MTARHTNDRCDAGLPLVCHPGRGSALRGAASVDRWLGTLAVLPRVLDVVVIAGQVVVVLLRGAVPKRTSEQPEEARHGVGKDSRLALDDAEPHPAIMPLPAVLVRRS